MISSFIFVQVFGFLGSEELRAQDSEFKSTGNYGIQDQRMAMDWVQENIGMNRLNSLLLLICIHDSIFWWK